MSVTGRVFLRFEVEPKNLADVKAIGQMGGVGLFGSDLRGLVAVDTYVAEEAEFVLHLRLSGVFQKSFPSWQPN